MTFDEYSALPNKKWYQVTAQGYFEAGAASRDAEIDGLHQQLAGREKQVTLLRDALEEATALARNLLSDAEQQVVEEYTEAPKVFKICDAALAATEPKP